MISAYMCNSYSKFKKGYTGTCIWFMPFFTFQHDEFAVLK